MRIEPTIWEGDAKMPATWRVVTALLREAAQGQAELRERTGLSHPVIVQQVALLKRAGLAENGEPITGQPGRPRIPITFNWNYRRILAVEAHQDGLTGLMTNLRGRVISPPLHLPLPRWTAAELSRGCGVLLSQAQQSDSVPLGGVVINLPGVVSTDNRQAISLMDIPLAEPLALAEDLEMTFGVPVLLESSAIALARALHALNDGNEKKNVIAISLRQKTYLGMGMLVEGQVVRGATHLSGGLGHVLTPGNNRPCACGRVGCLETLFHAARDDAAIRPEAMGALGHVLANIVTLLNPSHLIIQGDDLWSEADSHRLRATLGSETFPGALEGLVVEERPYQAQECLLGGAHLVIHHLLNPHNGLIDAWTDMALDDNLAGRMN